MRILAFETSAKAASVALLQDGCLLAEAYQHNGQTHSRTILAMAENLLQTCDLTPQDVDLIACAQGPGSFTGVRIGVAAAKGMAWGLEIPLVGVSTIHAMARGVQPYGDAYIIPAMDARRSQVYTGIFQQKDGILNEILPECAISLAELEAHVSALEGTKILVGDGSVLCHTTWDGRIPQVVLAAEHHRMQRATGVALCAMEQMDKPLCPPGAMVPNYLRLSQAEREKLAKTK